MGNRTGVIKAAATKAGVAPEAYESRIADGEKWCWKCKAWHGREMFGKDRSRTDGLTSACLAGKSALSRARYIRTPRAPAGSRRFVAVRDGDKKQARARVNYLVGIGKLTAPNDLPCADCGHTGSDLRHEYDHHQGYGSDHHESVQPVCSRCHHDREQQRTMNGTARGEL